MIFAIKVGSRYIKSRSEYDDYQATKNIDEAMKFIDENEAESFASEYESYRETFYDTEVTVVPYIQEPK